MSRPWLIYVLYDPRTPDEIRYVGKTHQKPGRRLKRHVSDGRQGKPSHCARWIAQLLGLGLRPTMTVIETGVDDGWKEAERRWIAVYRAQGAPLTNITDGGEGTSGWTPSTEDCARRGTVLKRRWGTAREELLKTIRDAASTPESREKKRLAAVDRQQDPNVQAKQTGAQKQSWTDPGIRARRVAGITKAQADPAYREAQGERVKAVWADPVKRAERVAALRAGWARKRAIRTAASRV